MLSFLAQDFFFRPLVHCSDGHYRHCRIRMRSGNPLSLASFRPFGFGLSHRMPRQTPSDDSFSELKFSRKIVLFNDSFVVFRPKLCSVSRRLFFVDPYAN